MGYQKYVSDELTHFVGRRCPNDDERYNLLGNILRDGRLKASGIVGVGEENAALLSIMGQGKISDETAIRGQIVCFCDILEASFGLHIKKYSRFGIAFLKDFLVARGANPVFYVVSDATLPGLTAIPTGSSSLVELTESVKRAELLDQIHKEAMSLSTRIQEMIMNESHNPDLQNLLFRIDHLRRLLYQTTLAFVKPFLSSEPQDSDKNYYMEREWRVYGDVQFQLSDVYRVILPSMFVKRFLKDFPHYAGELTTIPSARRWIRRLFGSVLVFGVVGGVIVSRRRKHTNE